MGNSVSHRDTLAVSLEKKDLYANNKEIKF